MVRRSELEGECAGRDSDYGDDTLKQTIGALARASVDALARHDVEFFAHLLDEAFVYINATGEALSKQEYLQRYVDPSEVQGLSQTLEGEQVRIYRDVAILTGRLRHRLTFAGEPFEGEYMTTRVHVRESEHWRCVSGHTSKLAVET